MTSQTHTIDAIRMNVFCLERKILIYLCTGCFPGFQTNSTFISYFPDCLSFIECFVVNAQIIISQQMKKLLTHHFHETSVSLVTRLKAWEHCKYNVFPFKQCPNVYIRYIYTQNSNFIQIYSSFSHFFFLHILLLFEVFFYSFFLLV